MQEYLEYCTTDRQREIIQAWLDCDGNSARASELLGINPGTVRDIIVIIRKRAAKSGFTESFDARAHVPPGHRLVGQSTYTKTDNGEPIWIKTTAERDVKQDNAAKSFIEGLQDSIPVAPVKPKESLEYGDELCPVIVIGDAHIGAKSWHIETKERDFDSGIASQEIKEAVSSLVDVAPHCKQGVLISVGDYLHMDSSRNTTTKGTPVSVDDRLDKVMRIAAETMIYSINRMLDKVENLEVICARGNHDSDLSLMLQLILEYTMKNEPRVTVMPVPGFYSVFSFGKNLLGVHHGDKVKPAKLAQILPRDYPKEYAESTYRLWCIGHYHSMQVEQFDTGVTVERFSTLCPPDSWHSSMGYNSDSTMTMFVLKKSGGRQCTHIYQIPTTVKELDARL